MSQWGLSKEEQNKVWRDVIDPITSHAPAGDAIKLASQATLRHVYEEGEKPCPHMARIIPIVRKRACISCWTELKQEAGLWGEK